MKKRKTAIWDDDEPSAEILGTGCYSSGKNPGTTKMKRPIGFIRPKTRPARPAVKKKK